MGRSDETCSDQPGELERRTFLGLAVGGAATVWVTGCGDDGIAADGDGSSGSDGTAGSGTGGPDDGVDDGGDTTTAMADGTTTGEVGDTSVADDTTGDSDGSSTGDPEGLCDAEDGFEEEWNAPGLTQDDTTFPMAVMAGEMRPESAMFTVYIEDAAPKILRVWRGASTPGMSLIVAELEVTPSADGYAKVSVDGLCPGTWYFYTWLVGKPGEFTARSTIGQVRTAIAEDALEPITIAISACNGDDFAWPALATTAMEPFDMFVHLGDMAYNDGATSLPEFRSSWRDYMSAQDMRVVLSRAGMYATWDDHEIDDNSNFDRETMDPGQLQKRQNAMDSYFELLPIDAEGPDYVLWRSFRWGLTLEVIVLDCRYERRPSQGLYMSQAQMDWLKDRLSNSPCQFKVIVNSVPITNMPGLWDFAANDRWEGYPDSRDELLGHINDESVENVWFVSGDFHVCFVSTLEPDPSSAAEALREISVTGGRSNILGDSLGVPQYDYGTSSPRACLLTFDPEGNYVNVRFIDPNTGIDAFNADLSYD